MHLQLLYCGIYLVILFRWCSARPIMFYNSEGFTLEAGDDNDIQTVFNLHSAMNMNGMHRHTEASGANAGIENDSFQQTSIRNKNSLVANLTMTPEYMLELYKNLSTSSGSLHDSNIVRSFKNNPEIAGNITHKLPTSKNYRVHSLGFDISALDQEENINSAELRLYTLIKRDQRSYSGVSRRVSIYQLINIGGAEPQTVKYNFLTSKFVHTMENAWESFDVTKALKLSIQQGLRHEKLQVRIESLLIDSPQSDMDITFSPNVVKQPLLVVYSNDNSKTHEETVDRYDLLLHELSNDAGAFVSTPRGHVDNVYDFNSQEVIHHRSRRSNGHKFCKRRPLYVNFADLNWDTWIIAPEGYQAYQCAGKCSFPMGMHLTPTKHALIQSLMHIHHPRRAVKTCCVPTKLDPISLLYIDKGVVTFKYKYGQMVVSECGCR
ncbi:Bone morphogenetic protein 10 [Mactra antiquata]